jgi:large subunit ribosomal protein L34
MYYPHKTSRIKRARKIGFRARMKTKKGRQMINRKRRAGRKVQVV